MNSFSNLHNNGEKNLKDIRLISASENKYFAKEISRYLQVPLVKTERKKFQDTDIRLRIQEDESVRGKDVYLITTYEPPISDRMQELLIWTDALISGSAERVTFVIPNLFGSRQDRKTQRGEPVNVRSYINALKGVASNHSSRLAFMTADLHSEQSQNLDMIFDSLRARPIFAEHIKQNYDNIVIVSPDTGAFKNSAKLAIEVNADGLSWMTKTRSDNGETHTYGVSGESVYGKTAIIMDDMIDSGGTLATVTKAIREAGAKKIAVYATHLLLTNPGNINNINAEIVGTDTIFHNSEFINKFRIKVLPLSRVFAEAIKRKHQGNSTNNLFLNSVIDECGLFDFL